MRILEPSFRCIPRCGFNLIIQAFADRFFSSVNDAITDTIVRQNARGSVLIKIMSYRSPLMFATAEREGDRTLHLRNNVLSDGTRDTRPARDLHNLIPSSEARNKYRNMMRRFYEIQSDVICERDNGFGCLCNFRQKWYFSITATISMQTNSDEFMNVNKLKHMWVRLSFHSKMFSCLRKDWKTVTRRN